jgi:hypothetical protein
MRPAALPLPWRRRGTIWAHQPKGFPMFRFLFMIVLLLNRSATMDCDWNMTKGWADAKAKVG